MIGCVILAVKQKYFLLINFIKDIEMNKYEQAVEIDAEFTSVAKSIGVQLQYEAGRCLFWPSMKAVSIARSSKLGIDGYNEESAMLDAMSAVKSFFADCGLDDVEIATDETSDYIPPEAIMAQMAHVIQKVLWESKVDGKIHCPPYAQGKLLASAIRRNRNDVVSAEDRQREESKLRGIYQDDYDSIITSSGYLDKLIMDNRKSLLEYLLKFGDDAVKMANDRIATKVRDDVELPEDWDDMCDVASAKAWEWVCKGLTHNSIKKRMQSARLRTEFRTFELA